MGPRNPFAIPEDTESPATTTTLMMSKSKTKYFSGHFTSPSALTTTYYPPSLVANSGAHLNAGGGMDYELRSVEEGDENEDDVNRWRLSSSQTMLNDSRGDDAGRIEKAERRYTEDDDHLGATRASKDNSHLKVRMMELGEAVDAGMKKPRRPPRLHPYVRCLSIAHGVHCYITTDMYVYYRSRHLRLQSIFCSTMMQTFLARYDPYLWFPSIPLHYPHREPTKLFLPRTILRVYVSVGLGEFDGKGWNRILGCCLV
jgi:hypothetical protein